MREKLAIIELTAPITRVITYAEQTMDKVIEHKSELTRLGGAVIIVGLVARVNGFRAGYKFAKNL